MKESGTVFCPIYNYALSQLVWKALFRKIMLYPFRCPARHRPTPTQPCLDPALAALGWPGINEIVQRRDAINVYVLYTRVESHDARC